MVLKDENKQHRNRRLWRCIALESLFGFFNVCTDGRFVF